MHEAAVLHNLRLRYMRNQIYSKSGPILIAVNPYQNLPIYSDALLAAYCGESARQLPPHVYAIGDQAFRAMVDYGKDQSILVTGESGAGKTETTKIILQYFATKGKKSDQSNVQEKVLESTPILEAFGNAKTLRNDNSSRFGKFIIVDFDGAGSIVGARLKTYLLEKSRLLKQVEGERNYHIFFELIAAVKKDINVLPSASTWDVRDPTEYNYLNTGGDLELGKDEAKNFGKTKKALEVVGLTTKEIDDICTMLMGILALGNLSFENNSSDAAMLKGSSKEWLDIASRLLGLEKEGLLKAVSTKVMTTGKDTYVIPLNDAQAEVSRDSLATLLYETLFLWLVERINESIATKEGNAKHFIGILDIYGFESFKVNSFEQFCINYANEKLQQQFNQHMFKLEQEEYQKEEIDWTYVKFVDNQACITLIEKHLGILSILNEESRFPKATPETFATKLVQKNSSHPYFEKSPFHNHGFLVRHYPCKVEYDTTYFLDKNRNMSLTEYLSLLQNCKRDWMKSLFVNAKKGKTDGGAAPTIASQFKDSLQQLMDTIHKTEANYIRCIKPNNNKKPLEYGQRQVLDQLRCNGVLEAIRIARDGFPTRYLYPTFWQRFRMLAETGIAPDSVKSSDDFVSAVKQLMGKIAAQHKLEMFQFGKTKLFLKGGQLAYLEDLRTKKRNDAAVAIQKHIRCSVEVYKFKRYQAATKIIQASYRLKAALRKAEKMRQERAALAIQKHVRSWMDRVTFINAQGKLMAATTLQTYVRMWNQCSEFMKYRAKVIECQKRWRGVIARKQYQKMRQEATKAANLMQQQRQLLDKITKLETELSEKSNTLTKVTAEEAAKNEAELHNLKAKLESYQSEIEAKNDAIQKLEQNETKSAKKMSEWQEKVKGLEKKVDLLTKYEAEAKQQLEQKENALSQLLTTKNELAFNNETLKSEIENVRKSLTTMSQDKVKAIEEQLMQKTKDLSNMQIELDNVKSAHSIAHKEYEDEKKILNKQIEAFKTKLSTESQELEELRMENQHLVSQINTMKKEIQSTNTHFEQEKQFLVTRLEQIQAELQQKNKEFSELQTSNLKLQSDYDYLSALQEKEKKTADEKYQQMRRELTEVQRSEAEAKDQLEQLQKSRNLLQTSNQSLNAKFEEEKRNTLELKQKYENELNAKSEQIATLNLDKQQSSSTKETMKREIEEMRANFEKEKLKLKSDLAESKEQHNSVTEEVEQLRKILQSREDEIRTWKQKHTSFLSELEAINPNIAQNSFGDHIKQLESEVNEKTQLVSTLEIENQQLVSKLKITSQELSNVSSNFQKEKQRFEREMQTLRLTVTEKTENALSLEQRIEKMNTLQKMRMQDLEETREALKAEKVKSLELVNQLQRELNESSDALEELQRENQKVKSSKTNDFNRWAEEHEAEKQRLEEELNQKEEELNTTTQKLQALTLSQIQLVNKHNQDMDRISFDAEHEKMTMEKRIIQLETIIEEKTNEIHLLQQNSQKLNSKQNSTSQLVDDLRSNLELEKKQHNQWREKYNQLKLESEKTIKEQRDAYTQIMNEQRDEQMRLMMELREDFAKKLKAAQQNPSVPKPELPVPAVTVEENNPALPLLSPRTVQSALERSKKTRGTPSGSTAKKEPASDRKSDVKKTGTSTGRSASPAFVTSRSRNSKRNLAVETNTPPAPEPAPEPEVDEVSTPRDDRSVASLLKGSSIRNIFQKISGKEEPPKQVTSPKAKGSAAKTLPKNQTSQEDLKSKRLSSRGPKPPYPVPDVPTDNSGMGPEKTIAAALHHLSPARYVQFRTLVEAVLANNFIESLVSTQSDLPSFISSGIPLPSFVILRYIAHVNHIDDKFLTTNDAFCLPTTLSTCLDKTEKMDILVPYLNITAVLLTILTHLTNPPSSDYVQMNIQWTLSDVVEPTDPSIVRQDITSKLQLVFAQIYGKTLQRLMKHVHGELKSNLLTASPTGGTEVVNILLHYLHCFQKNCMVPSLVQQFFTDVFTFMDATIFNETILRKDLCTFSSAFQLKMSLEEMLQTLSEQGGSVWLGNMESWFIHTRQIINCLTLDKKLLCQSEIRKQVCPDISLVQLKQMCSLYECEEFENAILSEVINTLMSDPEFDLSQSLLVNISTARINTKNVHQIEPTDIQNMEFSQALVHLILKQIRT
uniref:Myosin motor domain-containing protein n=1 Tax=Arcella intermedia TaxID=1963864 RepID=A0A6B2KW48_9EUKA